MYKFRRKSGEVFGDFDLDVAEISLSSGTFTFLFVGVVGFRGSRGSTLQSAVPVMGDKGLALVSLGRAVGIDIINMGKVSLKSTTLSCKQPSCQLEREG